jgi:hypothetical protein
MRAPVSKMVIFLEEKLRGAMLGDEFERRLRLDLPRDYVLQPISAGRERRSLPLLCSGCLTWCVSFFVSGYWGCSSCCTGV